jgi:pimeloyl-ACP methyl ester carboxylesterase
MEPEGKRKQFEIKKFFLNGKSLSGNFPNDPVEREITVIERNVMDSTPALIGLAGFFGSSTSFLNRSYVGHDFFKVLNVIAERKSKSFLIVLPDTITSYFGNQYVNSSAVGNYEDFIVKDVAGFIGEKYGKRKKGIFGKSSGGFGSYTLAAKHPEIFDGFVDVSGDSGFEYCYLKDFPTAISKLDSKTPGQFIEYFRNKPRPDNSDMSTMNTLAMAAFYSPDRNSKTGFQLPFDRKFHTLINEVWERWLMLDPLRNAEKYLENLRGEKVILQVGRRDEFSINIGMKGLSKILEKNKVKHEYREYDEGHFGIEYLYEDSLPSLMKALSE